MRPNGQAKEEQMHGICAQLNEALSMCCDTALPILVSSFLAYAKDGALCSFMQMCLGVIQ